MAVIYNAIFFIFIANSILFVKPYRILGIFPYNGKSHDIMFEALTIGLVERGHRVDIITHFPPKNSPINLNVAINLNGTLRQLVNNVSIYEFDYSDNPAHTTGSTFGNDICQLMKLEEFQKFIKDPPKDPPYDLVITELFGAHCYIGFGQLLKVPVVAVSTSVERSWISYFTGNNDNLAIVPNVYLKNFDKNQFWYRLLNVIYSYWHVYSFHEVTNENQTKTMRKYLNPNIPHIRDVERSVALILANTHPVIHDVKPLTSSFVQVSGLHIQKKPSKLSSELQKWLDNSTDGFVYFSLGSLIVFESLPTLTINNIYRSFTRISPVRVLLKVTNKNKLPPGLPKNVLTSSWISQQAVLSHKNIRSFITHGGLMGTQEALYYGVPIIGIPLFADQASNVLAFVKKHMGIEIALNDLMTSAVLDEALDKILHEPEYRENAKFYSRIFKDRPMDPMDTAVYWIEYVIRNGPDSLRSPAHDLYWWQLALLDVYAFVLFIVILLISFLYYLANFLLKVCFPKIIKKTKME